jgi:predicted site-specific integrase-resolvase
MANYLSITQAAREKQTTRATIAKWIKQGKLSVEEIAGRKVIVRDEKFLEIQAQEKAGVFALRISQMETKLETVLAVIEELRAEIEKLKGRENR